jgi:predicted ATP-dependent protease
LAFELLDSRAMLLVFPNTFEFFFIAYEGLRTRWDPDQWSGRERTRSVARDMARAAGRAAEGRAARAAAGPLRRQCRRRPRRRRARAGRRRAKSDLLQRHRPGRLPRLVGAVESDFRQIRAGALHRALGGFLVLHALDVLGQPFAWEALKRALLARDVPIENLAEQSSPIPTATLRPSPCRWTSRSC